MSRQDSIQRKAESKIYNTLIRLLFQVDFSDCNSGLKVFKRNALEAIIHEMKDGWHRYMLVLAEKKGYKVLERPVTHLKRIVGQSKYTSPLKLFKGLCDIIAVAVYLHKCKR